MTAEQCLPTQIPDLCDLPASAVNDIILKAGFRALLIVPLLRPDHIVGALVVRRRQPGSFPTSTVDLLQTYHWPGNIRELESTVARAALSAPGRSIRAADIEFLHATEPPAEILTTTPPPRPTLPDTLAAPTDEMRPPEIRNG